MLGSLTRRKLLENARTAGLFIPVARFFKDTAFAAPDGKQRLLLVFTPNGKHHNSTFVSNNNGAPQFTGAYTALNKHAADIIAFARYGFQDIVRANYGGQGDGHHPNTKCVFSGHAPSASAPGSSQGPQAPTIDQIAAAELLRRKIWQNPATAVMNVRLMRGGWFDEHVFYTAPGYTPNRTYEGQATPAVSTIRNPVELYDRLFPLENEPAPQTSVRSLWARGKTSLDATVEEINRMRAALPKDGQEILDRHVENLRKLEASLAALDAPAMAPAVRPNKPTGINFDDNAHYVQLLNALHEIFAAAFRADRTRVGVIQYGGASARFHVPQLGLGFAGPGGGDPNSGYDQHSHTHHSGTTENEAYQRWFSERMDHLLTTMKGTASQQSNILENALVIWGMEHGQAAGHQSVDVPFLMAGQQGGFFKTGRFLDNQNNGRGHTSLLLSALQSMGLNDITRVGAGSHQPDNTFSVARLRG